MNFNRRVLLILGLGALAVIIPSVTLLFGAGKTMSAQAASPALAVATDEATSSASEIAAASPPAKYLPYRNQQYHFSVYYPPDLKVQTYDESGDAFTVALQDLTGTAGFEVYVTPYSGTQVTEARFKTDEPSGTFNQPTHVTVDGVPATAFYGSNSAMGDTREIWLPHARPRFPAPARAQLLDRS
jgi:hypothetical protein